jgi:ferredoxin
MPDPAASHPVEVMIDETVRTLHVPHGANLRRALLDHGISPYAPLTRAANCGGRGLCATCGVHVYEGEPAPTHWHDRLAAQFGYPRLSCQIRVTGPMRVRILTEKRVWGARDARRAYRG